MRHRRATIVARGQTGARRAAAARQAAPTRYGHQFVFWGLFFIVEHLNKLRPAAGWTMGRFIILMYLMIINFCSSSIKSTVKYSRNVIDH